MQPKRKLRIKGQVDGKAQRSLLENPPKDVTPPYCLYTEGDVQFYCMLSATEQEGWNEYVGKAVERWNDEHYMDKQAHMMYKWAPPLSIQDWAKQRGIQPDRWSLREYIKSLI